MTVDLRDLYQEIILEHSRSPRNEGPLENRTGEAQGNNPLCGDRIKVYVKLDGDRVADARFEARGCAISIASASMMTDLVKNKPLDEAVEAFEDFVTRVTAKDAVENDENDPLSALMGVREFPTRIKCATLPWHTLKAALDGNNDEITTE